MKKGIKKISIEIMSAILVFSAMTVMPASSYAGSSVANPKATAVIASSCQISAQNLAFGNLVLPLSAQSASSTMSVLCSKNASYTIALAYGGVYGTGTNGDYWVHEGCPKSCNSNYNWYYEYNSAGQIINEQQYPNGPIINGATTTTIPGATYNSSNGTYTVGTTYAYGEMIGVASGDHVAYAISVPGNSAAIWNTGNTNYTATGTGATQTLPINGKLVPAQSSSTYPTPDYYMDTVTATITY
jgi:spore coat protein U-like protein